MKIEKIELSGFKSFAEKTTIQLHPGITGIVGPNGCGKSNLVDAIKWLLGEQSAKSLRGDKMDELIFNGSEKRKPKGMAEVSLYISGLSVPSEDNGGSQDKFTVISRRLYRSGESEYAINNNLCRLKDIKDLLLDTGLDVKNYFIFEQERITQLLNAKPQERRFLIEEIAGVIKYKVKKAEALQKLEQSKINLQRINDITGEVKRQLGSLDRQVKKAERFKKLSEERKAIELYLAREQFNQLKTQLSELTGLINSLRQEEAAKRAEIDTLDNHLQERRLRIIERERVLSEQYSLLEDKERMIAENEKVLIQASSKIESYQKDSDRLQQERQDNIKKIESLTMHINKLIAERDSLDREVQDLKKDMQEVQGMLKDSELKVNSTESILEDKRKRLFRTSDELSILRNERTRLETTLQSIQKRELRVGKELEELHSRVQGLEDEIVRIEQEIKLSSDELFSMKDKMEELISEKEELVLEIETKTEELQRAKEELASGISRLNSLRELILNETTIQLFKETESLRINGIFADIFEVPERYERAIEGILSERLNAFILSGKEDILKAIRLIKEKGTSRTPFLSKDGLLYNSATIHDLHVGHNAVRALDVVKIVNEEYHGFISAMLGSAIIVEDIEEAMKIRSEGFHGEVVTLDGDLIDRDGIVWSGKGKEVLRRKREIKELESIVERLNDTIDKRTEEVLKLRERLSEKDRELKRIEDLIDAEEARRSELRHSLDNLLQEKERVQKRISYAIMEKEEACRETDTLVKEIKRIDGELSALEERRITLEKEIEEIKNTLVEARREVELKRQHYTELRMACTKTEERLNSIVRDIENFQKSVEELTVKNESLLKTIEDFKKEREVLLQDIERLKSETSEHAKEVSAIKEKISIERQEIGEENQRFLEMEEVLKGLRLELDKLIARLNELDIQRAEIVVRLEGIKESVKINYGVDIEEFKDEITLEGSMEELIERLSSIRKKIEELGPVNPGIIEEYEELKERYNFLTSQQEDLVKSITELEEAIQKINATTRKKLREAFDALNEKFGEVFSSLFGGGKAYIELTDENNILESGIEIIAQPPGKRLQNINLLSGGEKALTALSLLIASFLIKPAPLCILDEADAPLDEANVERFAKVLKELSNTIQFIVITHNKTTMSYCDYLYGVTMEEPGVSKIISLQLTAV